MSFSLKDCPTLGDYIARYQLDAVIWKANKLLANLDNPILKNERVADICRTIALIPSNQQIVKDDYVARISKEYGLNRKTLEKYVADHTVIETKKKDFVRAVRKNAVQKLDGDPKTFPFFAELINTKTREFRSIRIDILKFVQLLGSFGFTRYSNDNNRDGYTFVRLLENVITEVSREEIIDFMENFLHKEYDFAGAGCDHVDAEYVINTFYEKIKKYFSKDLFARVRNSAPIIINHDTAGECFLYFKNGFVRITKEGWDLLPYDKMEGSVWQKQMLERDFQKQELTFASADDDGGIDWENSFLTNRPLGEFADYVWRVCGQKQQRFLSLCTILGYLMHDYYGYQLKAPYFTDSTISDVANGRTGKTLLMEMVGLIRSTVLINGKTFDVADKFKYEDVKLGTQIVVLNDIQSKGRYKLQLEDLFNDITDGLKVNVKFGIPFRMKAKTVLIGNKIMYVEGDSAKDRIMEFELSSFFSPQRRPKDYYGHWWPSPTSINKTGWDEKEWIRYDNFMCFCSQAFLNHGMVEPETINLKERRLLDGTCREFLEFMGDMVASIRKSGVPWEGYQTEGLGFERVTEFQDFEFDKRKLFDRFVNQYPDFKSNHFTNQRFHKFLFLYSSMRLDVAEPVERRSNGNSYIQFKEKPKEI